MSIISLIAAIDEAGGLGLNNQLLCHLPADLQHFKALTMGKPIIMGRKTFASIGRPLPGRLNIVLTRTPTPIEGVLVFHSLEEALNHLAKVPEIMIIGGSELFAATINQATRLYITRIHHKFNADVFFPELDESQWFCLSEEFLKQDEKNKYDLTFYTFQSIFKKSEKSV